VAPQTCRGTTQRWPPKSCWANFHRPGHFKPVREGRASRGECRKRRAPGGLTLKQILLGLWASTYSCCRSMQPRTMGDDGLRAGRSASKGKRGAPQDPVTRLRPHPDWNAILAQVSEDAEGDVRVARAGAEPVARGPKTVRARSSRSTAEWIARRARSLRGQRSINAAFTLGLDRVVHRRNVIDAQAFCSSGIRASDSPTSCRFWGGCSNRRERVVAAQGR